MERSFLLDVYEDRNTDKDQQSTTYLLLIGIDAYHHVHPLRTPVNDITSFYSVLETRYQLPNVVSKLLLNDDATRANIIKELDYLLYNVTETDHVIIYFAGHGIKINNRGFWIPVDAPPIPRDKPVDTGKYIRNSTIKDYISDIPSLHTLVIVDSCFSWVLRRSLSDEEDNTAYADRVAWLPSRWLITSGREEPVSDGLGQHSPFAHAILSYLRKYPHPHLLISDLARHVKLIVPRNESQTPYGSYFPEVGDQGGEMVLRLKTELLQDREIAMHTPVIPKPKKIVPDGVEENMVWIEPGSFLMGSNDPEFPNEHPPHHVTIDGFFIDKYPVTLQDFQLFVNDTHYITDVEKLGFTDLIDSSGQKIRKNGVNWTCNAKGNPRTKDQWQFPVIFVSWKDVYEYCKWKAEKLDINYKLPTEAQWEYAATLIGTEQDLKLHHMPHSQDVFPINLQSPDQGTVVYLLGNVWEWVSDWYDETYYANSPKINPTGPPLPSNFRIIKGGAWNSDPKDLKPSRRKIVTKGIWDNNIGFRGVYAPKT